MNRIASSEDFSLLINDYNNDKNNYDFKINEMKLKWQKLIETEEKRGKILK